MQNAECLTHTGTCTNSKLMCIHQIPPNMQQNIFSKPFSPLAKILDSRIRNIAEVRLLRVMSLDGVFTPTSQYVSKLQKR